jgi:hypothetical protein
MVEKHAPKGGVEQPAIASDLVEGVDQAAPLETFATTSRYTSYIYGQLRTFRKADITMYIDVAARFSYLGKSANPC